MLEVFLMFDFINSKTWENKTMIVHWRDIASETDVLCFPYTEMLDILEEFYCDFQCRDKYSYLACILRLAKEDGLITSIEYSDIRAALVGSRGFI
jgi:hypothetical protein